MAPLVLHNVPDDELYIGKDGVTRPFAVVGVADERRSARLRRQAATNTGSFGRGRTRPRTGPVGPGGGRRAQQAAKAATTTTMAADEVFGFWKKDQEQQLQQLHHHHKDDEFEPPRRVRRKVSSSSMDDDEPPSQSQGGIANANNTNAGALTAKAPKNQPTEVILRGYRGPDYQYAAIDHYERIAGRICEDYPRDPPERSRRGFGFGASFAVGGGVDGGMRGSAVRAAATVASNGAPALTPAERQAVMQRVAGGNHWVKVTFESAAAAENALYASPQSILGCLVYAELYRGVGLAPTDDVAVPDPEALGNHHGHHHGHHHGDQGHSLAFSAAAASVSPTSSTVDSGTVVSRPNSTASPSSATVSGTGSGNAIPSAFGTPALWNHTHTAAAAAAGGGNTMATALSTAVVTSRGGDADFCQRIPTARRVTLKTPEQALLPRESAMRSFVKQLPLLNRLTGTIIGNQVPRREDGVFDWDKASLYWKLMWFLDFLFGLFGGEILDASKDD